MAPENALNLIPMTKGLYGRSPIVSVSKEGLGSEIALVEKPTTWPALLTAKAPLWLPPAATANRLQCPLSILRAPTLEVGIFDVTLIQITIGITDSRRVGQNLLVRAVAAGEMIRRNDELLLHVELIDVGSGTQPWGAQFKEPYSDVLAHTEKLADEICHQLRLVLAPNMRTRGREPPFWRTHT